MYHIYSLISRTFLTWNMACILPAACTRNIPRGTKFMHELSRNVLSAIALAEQKMTLSGQMFAMAPMTQMKMTPTTIYRTYRRTSFFWRRRFLRFWTIKLTFITFACKINILWLIDRTGSSPVKRSIDLRLIRELPLILGIWLKFLLQLICRCG